MKRALFPASSQAAHRSGLALPHRATRRASAHPPLCPGIKTFRPSLFSHFLPSFLLTPAVSSLLHGSAPPSCRPSPIAVPRPCMRHVVDRLCIDHWPLTTHAPSPLPLTRPLPSMAWSEWQRRTLSFAVSCLSNTAAAQLERRWFHFGASWKPPCARLRPGPSCICLPSPSTVSSPLSWSSTLPRRCWRASACGGDPRAKRRWDQGTAGARPVKKMPQCDRSGFPRVCLAASTRMAPCRWSDDLPPRGWAWSQTPAVSRSQRIHFKERWPRLDRQRSLRVCLPMSTRMP